MANFDTIPTTLASVSEATGLLGALQSCYNDGKRAQALLAKYQAATDAKFVATVNTLFTASERTELSAMLTQINTLVSDWETNHRGALGLDRGI